MSSTKIIAIVLIVAGVLGLAYGKFSYTKDTHEAKVGPIALSVKDKETVNIPRGAGGGAIVMTSSGSAHRGDLSNIAYGASKAAVTNFARYVATIYGKQGIRCNTISPGLIRTEGGQKNVQGAMVKVMADNTLAPRLGLPEDIAAAVAYLVSDDGAFVTGQDIAVDGGMLAHMPYYSDFLNATAAW